MTASTTTGQGRVRVLVVDDHPVVRAGMVALLSESPDIDIVAEGDVHLFLCGGAPLDGERVLWWNFVASDAARIERGKADWLAQRFGQVPGETEFIPLPER